MSQRVVKENDNEEIESIEGPAKKKRQGERGGRRIFWHPKARLPRRQVVILLLR